LNHHTTNGGVSPLHKTFVTGVNPIRSNGGCLSDDLFYATSPDGLRWQTYPVPILDHRDQRFHFWSLYRASFVYEAATDRMRTILSARDTVWGEFGVVHDYPALRRALDLSLTLAPAGLVASPNLVRSPEASMRRIILNARP
jgi:hypothetical protein